MNPHPRHVKSASNKQFEAWSASYDRSLLNFFLFGPAHRCFLEEIVRWGPAAPNPIRHLDVGCATGSLVAMLAASPVPARCVGLDMAAGMVREARAKRDLCPWPERMSFVRGDAEHLPFPDDSLDLVTCSNSFHHYPHQAQAVAEMHRVLRPGGRLMIIDGFRDNVVGWFVFDVCIAAVEKGAVHHCTWRELRNHFTAAGFQDITHRKINWWFPLLLTSGKKGSG